MLRGCSTCCHSTPTANLNASCIIAMKREPLALSQRRLSHTHAAVGRLHEAATFAELRNILQTLQRSMAKKRCKRRCRHRNGLSRLTAVAHALVRSVLLVSSLSQAVSRHAACRSNLSRQRWIRCYLVHAAEWRRRALAMGRSGADSATC